MIILGTAIKPLDDEWSLLGGSSDSSISNLRGVRFELFFLYLSLKSKV